MDKKTNELPRTVTEEQIDGAIKSTTYHRFKEAGITVCCLTLENGASVIGHSKTSNIHPVSSRVEMMQSCFNAREQVFVLEAYKIREDLCNYDI